MKINLSPIITSILDTDAYKLYMQQAIFHQYKQVSVVAEFRCRDQEFFGKYVDEIYKEIYFMKFVYLTSKEYKYLSKFSIFKPDYLTWLKTFRFNPNQVQIYKTDNDKLAIKISGLWCEVVLWEVPILSVISELIHRNRFPEIQVQDAIKQFDLTINKFYQYVKEKNINLEFFKIIDFGTRRRFSKKIHYALINKLNNIFPYFFGTSNYFLSWKLNIKIVGTQGHEWFQAHQQICNNLYYSQRTALEVWLKEYPNQLGIALTDCITMKNFLIDFNYVLANKYYGLRHDSGDPFEWGEKAIAHYNKLHIDPMTKTLVFSDNLDLLKSLLIYKYFYQRINVIFGIGGSLVCNIPNIKPLNIVIKLTRCNGHPVAKLSDTPEKTICDDNNFMEHLKKVYKIF